MIPGEITGPDGTIELNAGLARTTIEVVNGGDRPVQVGSHYHFAEANPALLFDRAVARGQRLDIAGRHLGALRAGHRPHRHPRADRRRRASSPAFAARSPEHSTENLLMVEISRAHYRRLYGPTTGDRVRLADTDLVIEVERDLCAGGDEAVFGGGKVIRESMGQSGAHPR